MSLSIELCECCRAPAPSWASPEYEDEWIVLLGRGGEYLGVVCSGCSADEELLVLELEAALDEREQARTAVRAHGARERASRRRGQARRPRARARALASARRD